MTCILWLTIAAGAVSCTKKDVVVEETFTFTRAEIQEIVETGLQRSHSQAMLLAKSLEGKGELLPRTFENGKLEVTKYGDWVSGFFPGVLWMLYEDSGDQELKEYAELFTGRVESAKRLTTTHDLGFMLYCSFGNGYRLTEDQHYLDVIKEGTGNLLTRWNEKVGAIKSWDTNDAGTHLVIIDNMMNLEMLCFMSKETGDSRYMSIAETHANTTMTNHFRDDGSSWHVVSYDPTTGKPQAKSTYQGYSDDSAWARGQAWGLYGYTMMYRETRNQAYLEQARRIARFIVNHPRLPKDKVPYWDFDAPDIPDDLRDASAAAIMASALLELSQMDSGKESQRWYNVAVQQLQTLTSKEYLASEGENGGFILKHSVGHYTAHSEVDVPLTYADYYYVEALIRLKAILGNATVQVED